MHVIVSRNTVACKRVGVEMLAILSTVVLRNLPEEKLAIVEDAWKKTVAPHQDRILTPYGFDTLVPLANILPLCVQWDTALTSRSAVCKQNGDLVRLIEGLRHEPTIAVTDLQDAEGPIKALGPAFLLNRRKDVKAELAWAVSFLKQCSSLEDVAAQRKLFDYLKWLRGVVNLETIEKLHEHLEVCTAPGDSQEADAPGARFTELIDLLESIKPGNVTIFPMWRMPNAPGATPLEPHINPAVLEKLLTDYISSLLSGKTHTCRPLDEIALEAFAMLKLLTRFNRGWKPAQLLLVFLKSNLLSHSGLNEVARRAYQMLEWQADSLLLVTDLARETDASPEITQLHEYIETRRHHFDIAWHNIWYIQVAHDRLMRIQ